MRSKGLISYNEIYSVRLIYYLGSILGLAPPFDFLNHKLIICIAYKSAIFVLVLLTIFGAAYSIWGRIIYVYPTFPFLSKIVTDLMLKITLTTTNICSIVMPTFITAKYYEQFLNLFTHVCYLDKMDFNQLTVRCLKNNKYELVILHLLILTLCFSDAYVWITSVGFHQFRYYTIRLIQNYYLIITTFYLTTFVRLLAFRFWLVNNDLMKLSESALFAKVVYVTDVTKAGQNFTDQRVGQILETYCILMEQVSLFNIIFGWQVLFLVATILVDFIDSLNGIITFGFLEGGLITVISCVWTLEALILGVMCAASCEKATTEAYRTGQLSYKLILNLSVYDNPQYKILQDKLHILAELSTHRCPQFTAAGFFKINYTMILSLLGAVTSYFIIIVQFN